MPDGLDQNSSFAFLGLYAKALVAIDDLAVTAPDGRLLGKILVPEIVSNICFGGRAKHRLFITATTSLYSVILNRGGVQWP